MTYDDWKLATPPEYELDEPEPNERARTYCGPPPSRIWCLLSVDPDGKWGLEYAAVTRDEIEQHEADVLRDDPAARTLVKEYEIVSQHPKAPESRVAGRAGA